MDMYSIFTVRLKWLPRDGRSLKLILLIMSTILEDANRRVNQATESLRRVEDRLNAYMDNTTNQPIC